MSNLLPGYDAWLDGLFQQEMDARVEEEDDPDEEADDPCADDGLGDY